MSQGLRDIVRFGALVFLLVSIPALLNGYSLVMSLIGGLLAATVASSVAWPLFVLR